MKDGAPDCVETFAAPWPAVLVEMKDFIDLRFVATQSTRPISALRIFVSRTLVPQSKLQPHMRAFKVSLAGIPNCRLELKATEEAQHRIEIEYRR